MDLVLLKIKGISYSQTQSGAYALLLSEVDGNKKLPIVIGAYEAQAIAIALEEEIIPPRPLTHDLLRNLMDRFQINLKKVIIHKLADGVFYSSLICERDGVEEIIDSRTSDAIALALRFNSNIYTYKSIIDKAGINLEISEEDEDETIIFEEKLSKDDKDIEEKIEQSEPPKEFQISLKKLKEKLALAVKKEDYELAAKIRDELSKRKK